MFDPLGSALDGLETAVGAVAAVDPGVVAGDELGEALVELARLRSKLAGVEAALVADWDARQGWAADGARSGGAWLAHRCRRPVGQCRRDVRVARRLSDMAAVAAALGAGTINQAHARRFAAVATAERAELFSRDEQMLVAQAEALPWPAFCRALAYWAQHADETLDIDPPDDAGRRFSMAQTLDGWWHLEGFLAPVAGATVAAALARIDDELFDADVTAARAAGDDTALARTGPQRKADALQLMAQRSASTPADARLPRPLITVLVDHPTVGRICELANGTVVPPGDVAPLITDADIERVVFGPNSRILDVGHRDRFFRGATRRAIEVRDRECVWPGCHTPAHRCHIDHLTPHTRGGPTTQHNGALACRHHNHHKEPGGYTITRQPDGTLHFHRPDGRQIE